MAYILGIETATSVCSVALFEKSKVLAIRELPEGNAHANMLTTLIAEVVIEGGITLPQVDAICVSMGPGSYTGLRVGISTAKGLCFALHKPLIAVNTLASMAHAFGLTSPTFNGLICPMIDARRMEVYTAIFDWSGKPILPTEAKIINELSFLETLQLHSIAFIGNGAEKCANIIQHPNAHFYGHFACTALGLGELAYQKFLKNEVEDVAYFEPFYLKDFVGTTPK